MSELAKVEGSNVAALPQAETTAVSPLVAMLASGQLQAEHVQQALDLQRQHDEHEAKKLFNVALANFRSQVQNVRKDSTGHNDKRYASLGAATAAIATPCADNGLSYYWTSEQREKELKVTCHLTHSAGHSIQTSMTSAPDTTGNKNAIQAIGSAKSYLERYTLMGLLGLATEDDDGHTAVAPKEPQLYSDDKFNENWPKWKELVASGKKTAVEISMQLVTLNLTDEQKAKVKTLAELPVTTTQAEG